MTYAEIRRELLNSACITEYLRYGISKDTAAALLAADRSRMCALDAYNAGWDSVDEYYDEETRAQYSNDADKYEELASLYRQYAVKNGASYML